MTIKEFANMLDGREYMHEITPEEEALAKELGFVVVFGYSDDNAELRGAIHDEIGCFDGGELKHKDLPGKIYADWCPEDLDCSWAYGTEIPHEKFFIYEGDDLYCEGIVCDINKPKLTNADRMVLIERDKIAYPANKHDTGKTGFEYGVLYMQNRINELPEVDPVHAAGGCYCRECVHLEISGCYGECGRRTGIVLPNDFCSYGRRRDGADG